MKLSGPAFPADRNQGIGATRKRADQLALGMLIGAGELPRLDLFERDSPADGCHPGDGPGIGFPAGSKARNGLAEQALPAQQIVVIVAHDSASPASARWRL